MKKFISVLMVIISLFSISSAFATEMPNTKEDWIMFIDLARLELTKYLEPIANGAVLYEDENVKMTAISKPYLDDFWSQGQLRIDVIIENRMNINISCGFSDVSLNGWAIDGYTDDVPARKKTKGSIRLEYLSDTDITTAEEVQDIEGTFYYSNSDTWKRIYESCFYWTFNNQ